MLPTHQILILTPFCNQKVYVLLKTTLQILKEVSFYCKFPHITFKDKKMQNFHNSMFCFVDMIILNNFSMLELLLNQFLLVRKSKKSEKNVWIFNHKRYFSKDFLTF